MCDLLLNEYEIIMFLLLMITVVFSAMSLPNVTTVLRVNVIKYHALLFQISNSTEPALNII